jgi:ABC-type sugar transport system ATPase subunit
MSSLELAQTVLRMEGISKAFAGVVVLRGATLEAHRGEAIALMGANGAGKSTLMNILGGNVAADQGRISINGTDVEIRSAREATLRGIAFVHQELAMLPTLTVAENIFIDGLPTSGPFISTAEMRRRSQELMGRLGSTVSPESPIEKLSMGDRQLVEIARALRHEPRIIIFDEPTSSLTEPERRRLFRVISGLKAEGVVIIYITHFLDEIFSICERVTVMRNGETVWSSPIENVNSAKVVHLMLGVSAGVGRIREPITATGELLLRVLGLKRSGALKDISFEIREGEIVGLWGLLGSGRTELLRAMVGFDPIEAGTMLWNGEAGLSKVTPRQLHYEVGFVTEDRRGEGVHLLLSIRDNIALPNLKSLLNNFRLIDSRRERELAHTMIGRLNIKASGQNQSVGTLSGGNQQKIVFGRWLAANPRLFLLDEPTRGLDVSAKNEIMNLIVDLARKGCGVLLVSSELEELMRVCDRYLVMNRGALFNELPGSASAGELMAAIAEVGDGHRSWS